MNTLLDVVKADYAKNHAGREYSQDEAVRRFESYVLAGKPYFTMGPVVISMAIDGESVEFHCMNGGTGRDLTAAVSQFLSDIAGVCATATTYYDNPRISELLKFVPIPSVVTQINEGADRTYRALFTLRS